ncbi:MAG TPA: hypothetical protein VKU00_16505 [Chthonomonadaceae bacterium]|nr:hypothetical protein [Chthonomonadaceae bacterium]
MNTLTDWPPIVLLVLIAACGVGLLWACGRFVIATDWMHVSTVDKDGNRIGKGKWERIPKPDKVDAYGLNHIVKYVARMVKSPSPRCSLIIASPDGNKACLIIRQDEQLTILEHIMLGSSTPAKSFKKLNKGYLPPQAPEPEKEQVLHRLFADLQIAPNIDTVHDYNGYADAMRDLHYPIGNDVGRATMIIQRLLREVYGVQEADGLHFTFEG